MSRIRDASRRTLTRISRRPPPVSEPRPATQEEVARLRRRVKVLEREVQEARRLHRRLAELTDVVENLLVPVAQRDETRLEEFLDAHSPAL